MNDIGNSTGKRKPWRRWALEAISPAVLVLAAMAQTFYAFSQVGREPGQAIFHLFIGLFCTWAAFCFVIVRLKTGRF
jgi:hypothetical protein